MRVLIAVAALSCVSVRGLRTGVAPSYIASTRQKTSYETSPLSFLGDAFDIQTMYEAEQSAIRSGAKSAGDRRSTEETHNAALRSTLASTVASLQSEHAAKLNQDDQHTFEWLRNRGLEQQNVMLTAKKTTQDMFISLTNQTNWGLQAHKDKTLSLNAARQQEKEDVLLSLEQNLRDEWFNHENAIAVEAQRPFEIAAETSFNHQMIWLQKANYDMNARNVGLDTQVPGLTTARDNHEDAKIDEIISKVQNQHEATNLENHVTQLEATTSALQHLVTRFQAQNKDLTDYNAKLTTENAALATARNTHREKYLKNVNVRNAAQIRADYYQNALEDMRRAKDAVAANHLSRLGEEDKHTQDLTVCTTERNTLISTKASLQATYDTKRDLCNDN